MRNIEQDISRNQKENISKIDAVEKLANKLFKKQNLVDMEHRIYNRMDDLMKALMKTVADRNDVANKFRSQEYNMKCLFHILLACLRDEANEYKMLANGLKKGTSPLRSATNFVNRARLQNQMFNQTQATDQ